MKKVPLFFWKPLQLKLQHSCVKQSFALLLKIAFNCCLKEKVEVLIGGDLFKICETNSILRKVFRPKRMESAKLSENDCEHISSLD